MIYTRKYLQYNDIVFDNYSMLQSPQDNNSVNFKYSSVEYANTHGSYTPLNEDYGLVKERNGAITIRLNLKKLPCEYRQFYRGLIISHLNTPSIMWAVQNNEIIWTRAKLEGFDEISEVGADIIEIDCNFVFPDGIWHKANEFKTFLVPYDPCDFIEDYGIKEKIKCGNCCDIKYRPIADDEHLMNVDNVDREDALCNFNDYETLYKEYVSSYRIIYNCKKSECIFGINQGQILKTTDKCKDIIAGQIYSNTDIPTRGYKLTIIGHLNDVDITINGNRNIIKGQYEILTIKGNGDAVGDTEQVLADNWVRVNPEKDTYGFTFKQGINKVRITGVSGYTSAYFEIDELTI